MPENPLLPTAELHALLAAVRRCARLDQQARSSRARAAVASVYTPREAILGAVVTQLLPSDVLLPEAGDRVAFSLRSASIAAPPACHLLPETLPKGTSRLLLAASMTAGLSAAGQRQAAVTLVKAGAVEPGWSEALAWAQQQLLPLLVICLDASGPGVFRTKGGQGPDRFAWPAVTAASTQLKLPILTLDGEDPVAMYRGIQEALLRARDGGGPCVLWAALPLAIRAQDRSRASLPAARLARYMRARGIDPA